MSDLPDAGASTTGGTNKQVVAMFETYDRARMAREGLISAGIDRSRMELLDRSATEEDASFRYERNEEGIWAAIRNLFMPDDESHVYAEGIGRGHAMLVVRVTAGDEDRVIDLLDAESPLDVETHAGQWRQSGWMGTYAGQTEVQNRPAATAALPAGTMTPPPPGAAHEAGVGREEVLPVYEEQLRVGKREVGRGSVRVRSYVVDTPVQEQVRLREERVEVERRPVDRPVTSADIGSDAFRDRTIEVTATAEEAVIAKDTRVKEEIIVRKEQENRTQTVSDSVRHTEVEVEDAREPAAAPRTMNPTQRP